MKKSLIVGALLASTVAMSGCGTDVPSPNKYIDQAKSAAAQAEDAGREAAGGALGGDPNAPICVEGGTEGMRALIIGLQVLSQPNLDTLGQIRAGNATVNALFNADGVNQGIQDYRALDGHPAPGFKDPKTILDTWQDANDRMVALISAPSDPTQADIDSYDAAIGDQGAFIMAQVDVGVAKDTYCDK